MSPISMRGEWVAREQVELRGAGSTNRRTAIKRLPEVLAEHKRSIRILHTLSPPGVAMAGAEVFDYYKDKPVGPCLAVVGRCRPAGQDS